MKVEFNGTNFAAEINSDRVEDNVYGEIITTQHIFKNNTAIIFSILSLAISLCNLPFCLFMEFGAQILAEYLGGILPHWLHFLFAFSTITLALSVAAGVTSIVCFTKSKKTTIDVCGVVLSVISFVTVGFCLTMNIIGIVA